MEPVIRSGVTAIWPHPGDLFRERLYAAISIFNGYGEYVADLYKGLEHERLWA